MRRIDYIFLPTILLLAISARALTIDRPFERDPEGCGCFYGTLARNYLRYDATKTFAVPIQSIGITPASPVFYPNHPPLVPLLIAGTYRIVGWNPLGGEIPRDWQTRLSTTLFTLACVATIFVMIRSRVNLRAAVFASSIFALMPMTIVFGSQPDVINTQLVFFILLTVAAYERFARLPSLRSLALLCLAFAPAAMTDWPAFHLVPVLGLHFLFTHNWRRWTWIIAFAFFSVAMFAVLYGQIVAVTHDWRWMARLVARRTISSEADNHETITLLNWMRKALLQFAVGRHTWPVIALMLLWITLAFVRKRALLSIGLMLSWTVVHVLIGRQGVFVHEWWWWPLTAGAAMSAGVALDFLFGLSRHRLAMNVVATVLIIAFGTINFFNAKRELTGPFGVLRGSPLDYSVMEIGEAIRAAAPVNHAVMLADRDPSLPVWFYADRPIKQNVWDVATFEARRHDGFCDLQFDLTEPWLDEPAAIIVPKVWLSSTVELRAYLDPRYPKQESMKFVTYRLH